MFLPIFLRNVKYINFEVENLLPHTIIKKLILFSVQLSIHKNKL